MKLFVVTSGSYSDYGIEEIFSSKENAEKYIKIAKEYNPDYINDEVEEFELDPQIVLPVQHHKFKHWFNINMDRDGNICSLHQHGQSINSRYRDDERFAGYSEHVEFDYKFGCYKQQVIMISYINADSKEHAIKKCGEIRTQFKVKGIFPSTDDKSEFKKSGLYGKKFKPYSCEEIK